MTAPGMPPAPTPGPALGTRPGDAGLLGDTLPAHRALALAREAIQAATLNVKGTITVYDHVAAALFGRLYAREVAEARAHASEQAWRDRAESDTR